MENEDEIIRQAMSALGKRLTDKKRAAIRENAKGKRSPEARARMALAQQKRREEENRCKPAEGEETE